MEEAISCYEQALTEFTRDRYPPAWGHAKILLGVTLANRVKDDKLQNLKDAIAHLRDALQELRRDVSPRMWAMANMNLGNVLTGLIDGNRTTNLQEAYRCIEDALDFFTQETDPLQFLSACRLRARVIMLLRSPQEAITAVTTAFEALQYAHSLSSAGLLHSRSLAADYSHLSGELVALQVHLKDTASALKACDNGKASLLHSMIAEGVDIAAKMEGGERDMFEQAKNRVRRLKHELDEAAGAGIDFNTLLVEYREAKQVVDDWVNAVRRASDSEPTVSPASTSVANMIEFASRTKSLVILFFFAPQYGKLQVRDLSECLHAFTILDGEIKMHVADETLCDPGKQGDMTSMFTKRKIKSESANEEKLRREREKQYISDMGAFLSEILRSLPAGTTPQTVMIVPHRGLHKVPFIAIPLSLGSDAGGDASSSLSPGGEESVLLGEKFEKGVWIVPSMSVAMSVSQRPVKTKPMRQSKIVSVTCPRLSTSQQLAGVIRHQQGESSIPPQHIHDQYPPRDKIRSNQSVHECDVLHVNCHGKFAGRADVVTAHLHPSEVLNSSGLIFRGGAPPRPEKTQTLLSMVDIWDMRLSCRLACVIACSGAVVDTLSQNDESLSIGTGFLVGGARHVVCTLWPVDQVAAVVIMSRFYQEICGDASGSASIAQCLGRAQLWFRGGFEKGEGGCCGSAKE